MDDLDDDEIRELWTLHFPRRRHNVRSRFICDIFRRVVENRAAATGASDQDLLFELNNVLDSIGIPRAEFYQVEMEIGEE